jgi:pimeloyl-ACP methyl ester carboxylesterase
MQPIILLHGALGSKEQLEPLRKHLQKQKLNVLSFNFFGHGGEPFHDEGFGIKIFCWQLQNFIRANELQKPAVFGYSMGGYVALRLAYKFPDLLGDIITLGTKFDWTPETARKEAAMLDAVKIETKVPAFAESLKDLHGANDWKELLAKTAEMLKALGKEPLLTEKEFAEIENKVTICLGDHDNMVNREESESAAGALPNGKFMLLENTPHPIEKVKPETIAQGLLQHSA